MNATQLEILKAFFLSKSFFSVIIMVLTFFFGADSVEALGVDQAWVNTIVNAVFALGGGGLYLYSRIKMAKFIPALDTAIKLDSTLPLKKRE